MRFLFMAHSGLRYLVLLSGMLAFAYCLAATLSKRPVDKTLRIFGSTYVGLLDLQVVFGAMMAFAGRFNETIFGHLAPMIFAVAVAHVALAVNRKRAKPGYGLPMIGIGGSLVLIAIGIAMLGRGPLAATAFHA